MVQTNKDIKTLDEAVARRIAGELEGLKFGSLLITVHNGKIVQIDRTEKTRFERDSFVDIGGSI